MRLTKLTSIIIDQGKTLVICLALLLLSIPDGLAQLVISGEVINTDGESLPGVNVYIEGTQTGTTTDVNGYYEISVPDGDTRLVFSYVGYLQKILNVGNQTVIDVVMSEDMMQLDEVIVIGYGTQKKSDLTGAVTSVSAEDMMKTNSGNVLSAMQGKAAGVQITPSTGMPGSETMVRIRGVLSISQINNDNAARQKAIWIVDGVQQDSRSVNPADIESMEILKDASTGAIYGAAASNGVILVTTKKGSNTGKVTADVNYYRGWNQMPRKVDVLSGPQFADMINQLNIISNTQNGLVDRPNVPDLYDPDTMNTYNYQDLLFRTAISENIDFSVSGGSEKVTSYFSTSYNREEGILRNQDYSRLLSHFNIEYQINDWLKFGSNVNFRWEKRTGVPEWRFFDEYNSPINSAILFAPFQEPYLVGAHPDSMWAQNPISNVVNPCLVPDITNEQSNNYATNGSFYTVINPFNGLTFETRLNADVNFDNYRNVERKYYYNASTKNENYQMQKHYGAGYGYQTQNILTYSTTIYNMVNLTALAGFEAGKNYYNNLGLGIIGLVSINDENLYFGAPSTDDSELIPSPDENAKETRGYAYFGRLSLDYKSMVLLQGNFRRDASSVFGPKSRTGSFPGVSAGLKFSEIEFFKELEWLSFGKIRFGWGQSGNNPIEPYSYYALIGTGTPFANAQYSFDNSTVTNGAMPVNLPNTAIKWETVQTMNFGLDLAFFGNKLTLTIDKFKRSNDDMLYKPEIPGFAGWTITQAQFENNNISAEPYANIGKISSRGWEFTVGYKNSAGELKYDVSANLTYVRNRADDLKGRIIYDGSSSRPLGDLTRTVEGGEIGEFYGFKILQLFSAEDCDTMIRNGATSLARPRWIEVVKATDQPIKEIVSSFMGFHPRTGDSVFATLSHIDTVYVQNNAKAGDYQFWDATGDGVLNSDDYQPLGNPFAPYIVGLNINLEYKWFDLNMMWYGSFGNSVFNTRRGQLYNSDGQSNWTPDYLDNYYRDAIYDYEGNLVLPARNGPYPRLDNTGANQNLTYPSEFYVENGSFVKLRSIQIGVTLPEKYAKYMGVSNVRIYFGGRNLLTFTKYSGIDPEIELRNPLVAGIDKGGYPIPRTYNAGISIRF